MRIENTCMERGVSALSQVWHDEGPMVVGGALAGERATPGEG